MRLRKTKKFDIDIDRSAPLHELAETFAALTHGTVAGGNRVRVIQDASFFDALIGDLDRAGSSVHFENYLWKAGDVFERVARALEAAAARGIEVRVIYDAVGATTSLERLIAAGCRVAKHRRLTLPNLPRFNRRDHRKLAVIDGTIGFVFGHGISDEWTPAVSTNLAWRDTAVRIEGPAVTQLQAAFFENWMELTGEAVSGRRYFPVQPEPGNASIHLAYVTPTGLRSAVQRLHYVALQAARKRVRIQNPYFIPDSTALHHFREALERGVTVEIMLPSSSTTDAPIVQHASHHFFGSIIRAGGSIFEYRAGGLHQKVMVVDDEWASVGSTNFDPRSFRRNDEITAGIFDREVARELSEAFDRDLRRAERWTPQRWRERTALHRLGDFAAASLRGQL